MDVIRIVNVADSVTVVQNNLFYGRFFVESAVLSFFIKVEKNCRNLLTNQDNNDKIIRRL